MALKGTITYKGIAVADTHAVIKLARHQVEYDWVQDASKKEKQLSGYATVRFYKDEATYEADYENFYDETTFHFTPSVSNAANMNIVKQAYTAMKTMDAYKDMTDV